MLQSPFLSRIGGSSRVRDELTSALAAGRGVTAKVRWIPSPLGPRYTENPNSAPNVDPDVGRARWIHCTPLLGHNGAVGVWMVVLVDEDGAEPRRKYRMAPPVSNEIRNGKGWEREQSGRKTVPPDFGDLDGSMDLPYERERIKASRRGSMGQRSLDGSRPGSGHTVRATNGVEGHRGAFNDWDRRREVGSNGDGGSMESFALM